MKGQVFPYFNKRKTYFYIMEGNLYCIAQSIEFLGILEPPTPSYTAQCSLGIVLYLRLCLIKMPKTFYSVLRLMYSQLYWKECSKFINFMVLEIQKSLYSRSDPIRNLQKNLIRSRMFYSSLC